MYRVLESVIQKLLGSIILFVLMSLLSAFTLQQDSKQKVYIVADSSLYNYRSGLNTFDGHVKVDQGKTHLTADRLTTKTNEQHKILEAIAYGNAEPAHYWTENKPGEELIHAKAQIIKIYPVQSNIVLQGNVIINQGENSFQGQMIIYNMKDKTITVPPTKGGRSVLIFNPEK